METIRIALAGNPNAGKSTIFNALTGSRQHVGNWPGKTVEQKEGSFTINDVEVQVTDLPGTYSLSALSLEEEIARDFILEEKPDMVVSVIDATNLERNLYLTVQILELGVPVVVALNMSDLADSRAIKIDDAELSDSLGVPVLRTVASKGSGIPQLVDVILQVKERMPV